jgi:hypothetical protein
MLSWTIAPLASGDAAYEIAEDDEVVARGGFSKLGQQVGRGATSTGMQYFFEAPGGRRIWFNTESALRDFVEKMFKPTLSLGDRHQATLVGLMWAHELAYQFDGTEEPQPLPSRFPGRPDGVRGRLLDKGDDHGRNSSSIVWAAAEAAWNELRTRPLADRPFPILQ